MADGFDDEGVRAFAIDLDGVSALVNGRADFEFGESVSLGSSEERGVNNTPCGENFSWDARGDMSMGVRGDFVDLTRANDACE